MLRVVSRILASREDIMKAKVRTAVERALEEVIPKEYPGDFNQGLIELGAIVCVPNGEPKCGECPVAAFCRARKEGIAVELPVKTKAKGRKIEKRTVLVFHDNDTLAIQKRPAKGFWQACMSCPMSRDGSARRKSSSTADPLGYLPSGFRNCQMQSMCSVMWNGR